MIAADREVRVFLKPDGVVRVTGTTRWSYKGEGPIEIKTEGKTTIIPAENIAWVEQV